MAYGDKKMLVNAKPFSRHLLLWHLTLDGDPIETNTSWLLPVQQNHRSTMLKVFKPGSDEQNSADVLRYFAGLGSVLLIDADASAILLERAGGARSLMSMALSGGDDEAAEILADVVQQLHRARDGARPARLFGLNDWFKALFGHERELPILRRCADVARFLLKEPYEERVLHGDLHHENVLDGARGWLAIDPKGLYGERTYEVANLLGNPAPHGEIVHHPDRMQRLAEFYAAYLRLDLQRVLGFAFAHAGLAASWHMEDGQDPSYRLKCAEVLNPLFTLKF